jgi:hypothetical protein
MPAIAPPRAFRRNSVRSRRGPPALGDLTHDRQAEAGTRSRSTTGPSPIEAIPDPRLIFARNAGAVVVDDQAAPTIQRRCLHLYQRSVRAISYCVLDEVIEDVRYIVSIGGDLNGGRPHAPARSDRARRRAASSAELPPARTRRGRRPRRVTPWSRFEPGATGRQRDHPSDLPRGARRWPSPNAALTLPLSSRDGSSIR